MLPLSSLAESIRQSKAELLRQKYEREIQAKQYEQWMNEKMMTKYPNQSNGTYVSGNGSSGYGIYGIGSGCSGTHTVSVPQLGDDEEMKQRNEPGARFWVATDCYDIPSIPDGMEKDLYSKQYRYRHDLSGLHREIHDWCGNVLESA